MTLGIRIAVLFITYCFGQILCDTPANCTYDDIIGNWVFFEGEKKFDSSLNCENFTGPDNSVFKVHLRFPDVAFDDYGNKGFWTVIYNQGFEVVINYRKYFAFSMYEQNETASLSYCSFTMNGWSHDVLGKNWACYYGERYGGNKEPKIQTWIPPKKVSRLPQEHFVRQLNLVQKSWKATLYSDILDMSVADRVKRAGGLKSRVYSPPPPKDVNHLLKKHLSQLPPSFDWRNVDGINYVSPVRNQGSCGSCYAFSSLGMLESRLQIVTNNTLRVQFSPQDVVGCSQYSQGCEGGYPYLIAGKYAQDFGLVPEECFPYEGHDDDCLTKKCKRYYVAEYNYVGGYFGGCSEELMKLELVQNGPIVVAMEVYDDLMYYKGGIYHHVSEIGLEEGFSQFQLVNHGVLIVGYGVSNDTGEKFWIVKNSWGEGWGEQGYFRIKRGTNECSIESMAVYAKPIP